jgi:bifunctional UDP-N-acetylglucosamine pyrophosphorylase/glucosamine-1-phosphate N-acetyltransferase/UDP-N-acetylglucosamine pyrophosphorylase
MGTPGEQPLAIVLAAGQGTRMKSDLPKVLCQVGGRPMIEYVLEAIERAGIAEVTAVVGYRSDLVRQALAGRPGLVFVDQHERLGTGHAVKVCRERFAGRRGPVMILAGDSPMVRWQTLRALLEEFQRQRPACLLGTGHKANPTGLGRIVRDGAGNFLGIVEEKDARDEQRQITEVNLSCYVFEARELAWSLDQIRNDNRQGEYYLTDCPGVLLAAGKRVLALDIMAPDEALSVNTPEELAEVAAALNKRGPG